MIAETKRERELLRRIEQLEKEIEALKQRHKEDRAWDNRYQLGFD